MNCPSWPALVARRDAGPAGEAAWDQGLRHLDGCSDCRDAALAAEPTLVFQELPSPAVGDHDIVAMRQAVAALRHAHELERQRKRPRATSWWLLAALLAVMLGAALLRGTALLTPETDLPLIAGTAEPQARPSPAAGDAGPLRPLAVRPNATPASFDPARLPLVEDIDPRLGSLIQLVDDDVSIVMVLPARPGRLGRGETDV